MHGLTPRPVALKRQGDDRLVIEWADGEKRLYTALELRQNCPCATCKKTHDDESDPSALPILKPQDTQPITIENMAPQGNYAYQIRFSDGHETGIFSLGLLKSLGAPIADSES